MKKILKLLLIAAAVIVGVVALVKLPIKKMDDPRLSVNLSSAEANEWKEKINKLCSDGSWRQDDYTTIETGIHTARVINSDIISINEENALKKYLFASSCSYLNKHVNALFKQTTYPPAKIKNLEEMYVFLKSKQSDFDTDSSLAEAGNIFSEYRQLNGMLGFSSHAVYSHPLKEYSAISADMAKSKVRSLRFYNSHFSKNPSIRSQVENLAADRANAEAAYYMNLAKAVKDHYNATKHQDNAVGVLLDDEIRFRKISTNERAKDDLTSFVNNRNK